MRRIRERFFEKPSEELIGSLEELNKAASAGIKYPQPILDGFDVDWEELADDLAPELEAIAEDAAADALGRLEVSDEGMLSHVNRVAGDWAHDRAAELMGIRSSSWLTSRTSPPR